MRIRSDSYFAKKYNDMRISLDGVWSHKDKDMRISFDGIFANKYNNMRINDTTVSGKEIIRFEIYDNSFIAFNKFHNMKIWEPWYVFAEHIYKGVNIHKAISTGKYYKNFKIQDFYTEVQKGAKQELLNYIIGYWTHKLRKGRILYKDFVNTSKNYIKLNYYKTFSSSKEYKTSYFNYINFMGKDIRYPYDVFTTNNYWGHWDEIANYIKDESTRKLNEGITSWIKQYWGSKDFFLDYLIHKELFFAGECGVFLFKC